MAQIENGKQLLKRDFISGYSYPEGRKYPKDNGRSNLCCVCIGLPIILGLVMALVYFWGVLREKYSSVNAFGETFVRVIEANPIPVIIIVCVVIAVLVILYIRFLKRDWKRIRDETYHGIAPPFWDVDSDD